MKDLQLVELLKKPKNITFVKIAGESFLFLLVKIA